MPAMSDPDPLGMEAPDKLKSPPSYYPPPPRTAGSSHA